MESYRREMWVLPNAKFSDKRTLGTASEASFHRSLVSIGATLDSE